MSAGGGELGDVVFGGLVVPGAGPFGFRCGGGGVVGAGVPPGAGAAVPGAGVAVPGVGAAVPGVGDAVPGVGDAVPGVGVALPGVPFWPEFGGGLCRLGEFCAGRLPVCPEFGPVAAPAAPE